MAMKPVTGKLRKGGGKGLSGDALVGKVSQKTIDSIKKLGMTEALKLAGKNGKTSGGMAREFQEGVRRMYGAKRLEAAKTKYAPVSQHQQMLHVLAQLSLWQASLQQNLQQSLQQSQQQRTILILVR